MASAYWKYRSFVPKIVKKKNCNILVLSLWQVPRSFVSSSIQGRAHGGELGGKASLKPIYFNTEVGG